MGDRPRIRNRSPIVLVAGEDYDGPCVIEVQREEWLTPATRRYRVVYSARRRGRLGWDTARDLREALARAAYVPTNRRPAWLAAAVRDARTKLDQTNRNQRRPT